MAKKDLILCATVVKLNCGFFVDDCCINTAACVGFAIWLVSC